jgi:prolipoprotein diacylglyceryltransferase
MIPILFRTPWFFVYSYTAVFSLALILSMVVYWRQNKQLFSVDMWLTILFFGLAGGKLGFILSQWVYFQERPFMLWQGGFTYHSALLAGLGGLWIACWWKERPFFTVLHTLSAPTALFMAFGWMACSLEGCAFGAETSPSWLAADLPDGFGIYAVRYQTQFIGILSSLLIFTLTLRFRWNFWRFLLWISLAHLGIGLLRADAVYLVQGIRIDNIINALLALACWMLLQYQRIYAKKER